MAAPVYATNVDYSAKFGSLPALETAATVDLKLSRASRFIDNVLIGALYQTDDVTHIATDADIALAIKNATLEQASFWFEGYGSEFGAPAYDEVRIGTAHLKGAMRGNLLAPAAHYELSTAGILPISARTFG